MLPELKHVTIFNSLLQFHMCIFQLFYSDIKFLIGSNRKPVFAHRCILSARCAVFKAMFAEQSQKNASEKDVPFVLSDMYPEIFLSMLEFIYTNCVTLTPKIVSHIYYIYLTYQYI